MRFLLYTLAVACVVSGSLAALNAHAYDVNLGALSSTDAGTSNTLTVPAKVKVTLQCTEPSCYKTGTGTLTATCASNYVLPLVGSKYERTLDTGAHTRVAAIAVDAGNPGCQVFQTTSNP